MKKLITILLLFSQQIFATTYYVDFTSGNNANAGTSTGAAWKTLSKVNSFSFINGDIILLKKGEQWNEILIPPHDNLSFGTYGSGAAPKITAYITTVSGSWVNDGGGVWHINVPSATSALMAVEVDGQLQRMGRYPNYNAANAGYIQNTAINAATPSITGSALSTTTNWTGSEVVIRKVHWILDRCIVTNHTGGVVTYSNPSGSTYAPKVNYGYFFQNDIRTLDQFGEWFFNNTTKNLSMYFGAAVPSSYTIKVSVLNRLIDMGTTGKNNTVINGIAFEGANTDAIYNSFGQNLSVLNCTFNNNYNGINASLQNGIITGNTFNNTLNNAIKYTAWGTNTNTTVSNNTLDNSSIFAGMGGSGDGNGSPIQVTSPNSHIEYNVIDSSGYNPIVNSGQYDTIRYNHITDYGMTKDDGGAIYTAAFAVVMVGRDISYNVIANGIGATAGTPNATTPGTTYDTHGIYLDANSNRTYVHNNSISDCTDGSGVFMNQGNSNVITNNNIYNTRIGFRIDRPGSGGQADSLIYGVVYTGNVVYPTFSDFRYWNGSLNTPSVITITTSLRNIFATLNSNYYRNTISAPFDWFYHLTWGGTYVDPAAQNLAAWQTTIATDNLSVATPVTAPLYVSNPSSVAAVTSFSGLRYNDVYGNVYDNSVTVPAWESKILFLVGAIPPANPPVVNAGVDKNITLPTSSTSVTGTATDDGTVVSTLWTKISGPVSGTITTPAALTTTVTGLVQGTYLLQLKATDDVGAIGYDTMQITVNPAPVNVLPVVNAGVDKNITLPTNTTSATGTATDADGTIASVLWAFVSGPATATFGTATSLTTTINSLTIAGTYVISFTATDNSGGSASDFMQVFVAAANIPPVANAGADQSITLPVTTATLVGSGTDVDGTIVSYLWTKLSGPAGTITSPASATTGLTGLTIAGNYLFQLTVTDNNGATGFDVMQLTVNPAIPPPNIPPTANAGSPQVITLPTSFVTLTGSGTDPDGTITAYQWTKISGGTATITSSTSATTTVTGLAAGVYQFRLRVTDNNGDTGIASVQITVNAANIPPNVNAGSDQSITLPANIVNLSATVSDVDGTIVSLLWTKLSGPAGGTISIPNSTTTDIISLTQGVYLYQIRAIDNKGDSATDAVQITVLPQPVNIPPVANAGSNLAIRLPVTTTALSGFGTDADGYIFSYRWTLVSSPSGIVPIIQNPTSNITGITGLNGVGSYVFRLTVTDNSGGTAFADVTVIVAAPTQSGTVSGKIIYVN